MDGKITSDSRVVIVGGGIAGLFAASNLLAQGVKDIVIVEKSERVGGLLCSAHYSDPLGDGQDYVFDFGTHFILKTGDAAVDSILDLDLGAESYNEFTGSLAEGQYINGTLYKESGCVNATCFSPDVLAAIKSDIENVLEQEPEGDDLKSVLIRKYGETAVEKIYSPALKKFSGVNLEEIDPSLETSFCASRLIVADREESKTLKQDKAWDERVAYAHYEDGESSIKKYYPKVGGIQQWIDDLKARLEKKGVRILASTSIDSFGYENGVVSSVTLSDGNKQACDFLFWTLPPIFLAKTLGIDVPSMPPSMRSVSIVNIITDQKPAEGPYWITVYDPVITSYRVTLYDNFTKSDGKHRVSVEVLHGGEFEGNEQDRGKIFDELKTMGVLPEDASCLWSGHEFIPAGFPVLKPGDTKIYDEQNRIVHEAVSNLHIVSRYRGGSHGQIAIMENIYHAIMGRMERQQYDASYA